MLSGLGLWTGSTIADIVFAARDARRWNARHELTFAPAVMPSGDGFASGLLVGGRF